uniref:hypothetical protein n=1 Tax=Thaumasiovibrio occultus TaxID=1891184 RepID=UPI000B35250D|nr:hypothetical protein [Thaumasiovibrio occultus]
MDEEQTIDVALRGRVGELSAQVNQRMVQTWQRLFPAKILLAWAMAAVIGFALLTTNYGFVGFLLIFLPFTLGLPLGMLWLTTATLALMLFATNVEARFLGLAGFVLLVLPLSAQLALHDTYFYASLGVSAVAMSYVLFHGAIIICAWVISKRFEHALEKSLSLFCAGAIGLFIAVMVEAFYPFAKTVIEPEGIDCFTTTSYFQRTQQVTEREECLVSFIYQDESHSLYLDNDLEPITVRHGFFDHFYN